MNKTGIPVFPCSSLPDNPSECRLLGLYPQRQEGLWMQRVKILGGMLTPDQWDALGDICIHYTPSTPIHLTTRQDIEFHNITSDIVPALQKDLIKIGLSGHGACGDTLRNITICPGNGLCEVKPDVSSVAFAVENILKDFSGIYTLPRKFKISFSACSKACAQPWINDLGFIADTKKNGVTFKVIGAGSLGSHPATGIILHKNIPVNNVPAFTLASVRLFNENGDRKIRSRARLRHVRERLGDYNFIQLLENEFDSCLINNSFPAQALNFPDNGYSHVTELNVPFGALKPAHTKSIANLMLKEAVIARLQNHHRISLFALNTASALKAVKDDPTLHALAFGLDIAACPGSTYCKQALVNTHSVEEELRAMLPANERRSIRISGCPNGCAHSSVAQIGLSGRIRKDDKGDRIEGFQVLTGGGMGLSQTLAEKHTSFIPSTQVVDMILKL